MIFKQLDHVSYMTHHRLIIGNCAEIPEIEDKSVHLIVTSPPYYNAPHDYMGLYPSYDAYLDMLRSAIGEMYRVLDDGRIFVLNIDDILIDGLKYPILADATKISIEAGFRYRDRIMWKKPDGFIRTSRRSGVLLQNPYPMYFYPDYLNESILIFQKGKFDYKSISEEVREVSKINTAEYQKNKWYLAIWEMTNVLPNVEFGKGIAAFPEELPYRAVKLFSYKGETVLDPFAGTGTTMYVARDLDRNSIGIEINKDQASIIKEKLKFTGQKQIDLINDDTFEMVVRD